MDATITRYTNRCANALENLPNPPLAAEFYLHAISQSIDAGDELPTLWAEHAEHFQELASELSCPRLLYRARKLSLAISLCELPFNLATLPPQSSGNRICIAPKEGVVIKAIKNRQYAGDVTLITAIAGRLGLEGIVPTTPLPDKWHNQLNLEGFATARRLWCVGAPLEDNRLFCERIQKQLTIQSWKTLLVLQACVPLDLHSNNVRLLPFSCERDTRTFSYKEKQDVSLGDLLGDYLSGRITKQSQLAISGQETKRLFKHRELYAQLTGPLIVELLDIERFFPRRELVHCEGKHYLPMKFSPLWLLADSPYPKEAIEGLQSFYRVYAQKVEGLVGGERSKTFALIGGRIDHYLTCYDALKKEPGSAEAKRNLLAIPGLFAADENLKSVGASTLLRRAAPSCLTIAGVSFPPLTNVVKLLTSYCGYNLPRALQTIEAQTYSLEDFATVASDMDARKIQAALKGCIPDDDP